MSPYEELLSKKIESIVKTVKDFMDTKGAVMIEDKDCCRCSSNSRKVPMLTVTELNQGTYYWCAACNHKESWI